MFYNLNVKYGGQVFLVAVRVLPRNEENMRINNINLSFFLPFKLPLKLI